MSTEREAFAAWISTTQYADASVGFQNDLFAAWQAARQQPAQED